MQLFTIAGPTWHGSPGMPEGPRCCQPTQESPRALLVRACRPEASRGASKELTMTLICRWSWARSALGAGIHSNHHSWVTSAGSCGGPLGPADTLLPVEGPLATSCSDQERREHEPGNQSPSGCWPCSRLGRRSWGIAGLLQTCSLQTGPW